MTTSTQANIITIEVGSDVILTAPSPATSLKGVPERLSLKFLLITQARNNIMDWVIYHFFTVIWTS